MLILPTNKRKPYSLNAYIYRTGSWHVRIYPREGASDDGAGKVRMRNLGREKPATRCCDTTYAVIYARLK